MAAPRPDVLADELLDSGDRRRHRLARDRRPRVSGGARADGLREAYWAAIDPATPDHAPRDADMRLADLALRGARLRGRPRRLPDGHRLGHPDETPNAPGQFGRPGSATWATSMAQIDAYRRAIDDGPHRLRPMAALQPRHRASATGATSRRRRRPSGWPSTSGLSAARLGGGQQPGVKLLVEQRRSMKARGRPSRSPSTWAT